MDYPREIMRRIYRQRPQEARPATPAPTPVAPVPPQPTPSPAPTVQAATPAPEAPPRVHGGHALYSAVMRSHDRMGTRHLN